MGRRIGVLAALALLAARPAFAAVPTGNLLQNPGAEAGQSAANAVVPVPGWTTTGGFTVDSYTSGDDLSPDVAAAVGGGSNYFYGGPDNPTSNASQTIDVSAYAADVDRGGVAVTLGGALGGYSSQHDSLKLEADFLGADGRTLGTLVVDGPTAEERRDESTLIQKSATGELPAGTREIRVTMTSTRTDGADDDGLADNLFLRLGAGGGAATIGGPGPVAAPRAGVAVDVAPGGGTALVQLPGAKTFARLVGGAQVPVGAVVDATRGTIALTSSGGTSRFSGGVFTVREPEIGGVRVTTLTLAGGNFAACPKQTKRRTSAVAPPKVVRQLFGNGKGRFRTTGRFASATVRGTVWVVQDRCDGTLVRVVRGAVAVADLRRHRTVLLAAGRSYLARR